MNPIIVPINGTNGASLHCINTQTGKEKWVWSLAQHPQNDFLGMSTIAYSPNGHWLVGEAYSHDFFVYRAEDGSLVRRLHPWEWAQGGGFYVKQSGQGFSRDGKTLVGRGRSTVQVWDTSTLQ